MKLNKTNFELRFYNFEDTLVISRHKFGSRTLGVIWQNYILNRFEIQRGNPIIDYIFNVSCVGVFESNLSVIHRQVTSSEYNKALSEIKDIVEDEFELKKCIDCINYLKTLRNASTDTLEALHNKKETDKKIVLIVREPFNALINGVCQDIIDIGFHIAQKEVSIIRGFMDDEFKKYFNEELVHDDQPIFKNFHQFKDDESFKKLFRRVFDETVERVGLTDGHRGLYLTWLNKIINTHDIKIINLDASNSLGGIDLVDELRKITDKEIKTPEVFVRGGKNKEGSSNKILCDIILEGFQNDKHSFTRKRLNEFLLFEQEIFLSLKDE